MVNDVEVDGDGQILVCDAVMDVLQICSEQGDCTVLGSGNPNGPEFSGLNGVAVDNAGNTYVAGYNS